MAPRETENSAYAKFWGDKQRALWCVMVFSGVANRSCDPYENSVPIVRLFHTIGLDLLRYV